MTEIDGVVLTNTFYANRKMIEMRIEELLLKARELRKSLKAWDRLKKKNDEYQAKLSEMLNKEPIQMDAIEQLDKL